MRLPGLGPKTAARIWRELGVTTLAELKAAAEGERLRTLAGIGADDRGEDPEGAGRGPGQRRAPPRPARDRAARRARGRRGTARAPCRGRRLRSGQHAPPPRDVPRSRRDRDRDRSCGADRALRRAALGARGRRPRRHQGDGDHASRACGSTSGSSRPRATATCSSTSPARRSTTSPCASRRSATGSRSPSTASRWSRRARCKTFRDEESLYAFLGYSFIPPELRENGGELEAARRRRAAAARRARRPARRDALPLDLVGGRQGVDRGDGGAPRRRAATSSSASPTTRTTCGRAGSRSSGARSRRSTRGSSPSACCAGSRRTSLREGEVDVADELLAAARLGRRVAAHLARPEPDRARAGRDRQPARRLHRASDGPPDLAAPRRRPRPRPGRRRALSRRAPRSRSTASPTGSTCAMRTRGSPERPA